MGVYFSIACYSLCLVHRNAYPTQPLADPAEIGSHLDVVKASNLAFVTLIPEELLSPFIPVHSHTASR